MTARAAASVALDGCKGGANMPTARTTLWQSEIDSPHVALSLACCALEVEMNSCSQKNASASSPASLDLGRQVQSARDNAQKQSTDEAMKGDNAQKQSTDEAMKGDQSTEEKQYDEVGSAMTEEFDSSFMGVSENGRQLKLDAVPFKDWVSARSMGKNPQGVLERMESGLSAVTRYGGESNGCEDLRRYSMSMDRARRLTSSQYKGVVPESNGQWDAQICEKHQRIWLGTFNRELDAARAYDGAFLKFRRQDAMTDISPMGNCDGEFRFMREHAGKEEIIDMVRKDTYDRDFDHHNKRIIMTAARSAAMNNAEEPSGPEGSDLRDHVGQKMKEAVDGNAIASSSSSSSAAVMACLPGEHLFDKAVTPSDVGKLNRLVIPKQHAEKYFPLDINSSEKGLLLDFEDNTGKVWTFRYSYWNSSQSYVLTKGWTRFVKDKKLEAGDIVSFQRGSTDQRHQLYISWRRGPSGRSRLRFGPQLHQPKAGLVYPAKGSSSLNPFNSGTQAAVFHNSQWMPIMWPSSSNSNTITQFNADSVSPLDNKVVQWDAVWSESPVTPLHGTRPFSLSAPPQKQTVQSRFYDINSYGLQPTELYPSHHNSLLALHPFASPAPGSVAQELESPEHKPASSVDLTAKKGVRLFGVTLAEPQRLSAQHHGPLSSLRS